jgi:predicted O-linked N-acetylglucosamine transferase (SPINDLY family)
VQISYLGYPNTTGLSAMDYRLTDARCDPPGLTERFHTETLLRIEPSFLCYRPPSDAGAVAALPARTTGCITFGSFNNFAKVTPAMLRTWAAILRQVSGSRLILKAKGLSSPAARQRVLGMFAAEQIDAQRIELLGQQPSYARHLEAYARIDIALDTFPYCGTTTTCEALWMGVPVISRAGPTHVSRVGCSILSSAGLPQFVAETEAQYIAISARLAEDSKALSEMRLGMRQRLAQSQLCDEQAFVRGVEAAYIRASQRSALTTDPAAGSTPPQTAASSDCNRTTEPKDR